MISISILYCLALPTALPEAAGIRRGVVHRWRNTTAESKPVAARVLLSQHMKERMQMTIHHIGDLQDFRADPKLLRDALEMIDGWSQTATDKIAAVANLAHSALEGVREHQADNVRHALLLIGELAMDLQNHINCQAERVGCNYSDPKTKAEVEAYKLKAESKGNTKH